MIFSLRRRQARVALDDGGIDPALLLSLRDGFYAGSHDSSSALIRAARDEVINTLKQRYGQTDSNLMGDHTVVYQFGMQNGRQLEPAGSGDFDGAV